MSETSTAKGESLTQRLKRERRKRVKRFGKRLIRGLADFLGRQSLVRYAHP